MLLTLAGRLAQFVIMFASIKVMTQLLSPTEMGKVTLITTLTTLLAMFLVNPVGMFINRRLHVWVADGSFRSKIHLFGTYVGGVSIVAASMLAIGFKFGLELVSTSLQSVILLVSGSLVFNSALQVLISSLNMVQRTRPFVLLTVGTLLASLGASIVLNVTGVASAERWLAGTLFGQAVFSVIAYFVWFRGSPSVGVTLMPVSRTQVHRLFGYGWPIAIAVLLQWLHMQGYRFWLAEDFGLARLGVYAAGYGVAASLISAFETILTTWFQPVFYRMVNSPIARERDSAWSAYAAVMVPTSIIGVSALIAASPALPIIFLGPAFHDAGLFVMLGAAAEWGRMMLGLVSLNAHRHMNTRKLIGASINGVIFTYCGLIIGLPVIGLPAAPLLVFGGACTAMVHLCLITFRSDPNLRLDWRPTVILSVVVVIAATVAIAIQEWLGSAAISAWPILICVLIAGAWSLLAWLLRHQFTRSFKSFSGASGS